MARCLHRLSEARIQAVEITHSSGPGGKLIHVEMRIGDSLLMFRRRLRRRFGLRSAGGRPLPSS